jgi:hypothetical protein
MLFCFLAVCNFLAPYNAPAAIKNEMPPSIGTQGGGQQAGPVVTGGAGAENALKLLKHNNAITNVVFTTFITKGKYTKNA